MLTCAAIYAGAVLQHGVAHLEHLPVFRWAHPRGGGPRLGGALREACAQRCICAGLAYAERLYLSDGIGVQVMSLTRAGTLCDNVCCGCFIAVRKLFATCTPYVSIDEI